MEISNRADRCFRVAVRQRYRRASAEHDADQHALRWALLPQNELFSSTPPAPQYGSITPATTPADLAPVFALGFGSELSHRQQLSAGLSAGSAANPDGGFPTLTTGIAAVAPGNTLRQDLKTNDLRNWTPTAPVLLCGGSEDPDVFFFNTQLMQRLLDREFSNRARDGRRPRFFSDAGGSTL